MTKKLVYLMISVLGNALGTALMVNSDMGLTAWGSAAFNLGTFFHLSFGTAFILLALFFFGIAIALSRRFHLLDIILSLGFLVSFGMLSDVFIGWLSFIKSWDLVFRVIMNFFGLCILLYAIALHLKILIAVHPCDVFLYQMQVRLKSDFWGTNLTYGIAFGIAIAFGLFSGAISGIGLGTIMTVTLSGAIIRLFNRTLLVKLTF